MYDDFSEDYDRFVNWAGRLAYEMPFLELQLAQVAPGVTVLDSACGTGMHAIALAQKGYAAVGADLSPRMVERARENARQAGVTVRFEAAGFGELAINFGQSRFDALLCLGNSLPHLLTQDDLVAALRGMAGVLRPGGALVLQNLNYDLRWQKQPRWFMAQGGVLDGQEVLVWRFADYDVPAGCIAFHIALFRKDAPNWQVEVHTTPHRPLFRADLLAALTEAGFIEPCTYGRMARPDEAFDVSGSGDLVVVAWKG